MSQEEAQGVIAAKARASGKPMTESELDRVTGGIVSSIVTIHSEGKKIEAGAESAAHRIATSI